MKYLHNLCVSIDQLANTLLAGYPDETLSSRSYRCRNNNKFWRYCMNFINFIFFDKNHCFDAFQKDVDLPKEYKNSFDKRYD